MHGLHLTADLYQCACEAALLTDAERLGALCVQAVSAAGLQSVAQLFHTFPATPLGPGGVTATVLLAESHLCVHTWPEQAAVTLDVYVCNFGGDHSAKAQALMAALQVLFRPETCRLNQLARGALPELHSLESHTMHAQTAPVENDMPAEVDFSGAKLKLP